MMGVKLSVIIVNYNVKYFLGQCLSSLYQSDIREQIQVIVVDNASNDGSVQFVKKYYKEVILIENKDNLGFSKANNQGLAIASGEYVLLLNPDTLVRNKTLTRCIDYLDENLQTGAVGIKMVDGSGNFLPESKRGLPTPFVSFCKVSGLSRLFPSSSLFNRYHLGHLDENGIHDVDVLSGAFMMIKKEVLDQIGTLDEDFFMYGEDIDLSYRITKAGFKIAYLGDAVIVHFKGESTKKSTLKYHKLFYSAMSIFADKHFASGKSKLYQHLLKTGILLRGGIDVFLSFFSSWSYPLFFVGLLSISFLLAKIMMATFYHNDPSYYPENFIYTNLPMYVLCHLSGFYILGNFHKRLNNLRLFSGQLAGLSFTLIVYALLPEELRNSRAIPVVGSVLFMLTFLMGRQIRIKWINKSAKLTEMIIAGHSDGIERMISKFPVGNNFNYVGFVSNERVDSAKWLGYTNELVDITSRFSPNLVIFNRKDYSFDQIIQFLTALGHKVEVKLFSEDAVAIVGSQSKNKRGEIYTRAFQYAIRDPFNRHLKRVIDIFWSLIMVLLSPLLIWIFKHRIRFIHNCFNVLTGKKTWIGYLSNDPKITDLPSIRPCVISSDENSIGSDNEKNHKLNFLYAAEYTPWEDVKTLITTFSRLDA